jgi:alanine racemase
MEDVKSSIKNKISTCQNFMGYVFVKDLFIKEVRVGIIMY